MFTHLVGDKASELNDLLTQGGFRRSQNIAYRPACETLPRLRLRPHPRRRVRADEVHAAGDQAQRRHRRERVSGRALDRAVLAVPALSRRPAPPGRHVRHDRARLRHDGRGHACRNAGHRIPARERGPRRRGKGRRRTRRHRAHRRHGRRPVDGLFLLRSGPDRPLARHLHDPRPHPPRPGRWACRTSISATGCTARARWSTRSASSPRNT